ncbi:Spore germination protein YndE [uncultured Roseburia sp.]|uniref:Spore germination protein n=1 Tax=Brotonthovivens ammoniilytica TaxID=2981725 RepID=A0ABT2TLL7_9FIRM|nr:GerAB/ArcD/ProY family transporter [Brotonthovivens ammoniilytica]MCU6763104.1 spore germination protein [Brotonthovivens ammoniilytica]SCJ03304.1 Spore germination protein YndE [uncultured Roseburia sp.]
MEQDRVLFSNNRKVSIRQMKRLLFLEIFGISSLLLPGILAKICRTDGVFAMAAGAFLAAVLVKGLCRARIKKVMEKQEAQRVQNSPPAAVSVFQKIRAFLLLLLFCALGGFLLYVLTTVIENQLLDTEFIWIILLTLLIAGGYGVSRGVECRARIYEILFWFLLVPLIIMLILAARDVNADYWLPVFFSGWGNFLLGTVICFGFFMISALAVLFMPYCAKPEQTGSAAVQTICLAAALNIGLYLILLGVFQADLLASLKYPVISLMAMAQIPGGLFERQDALMVAIWFFSLFSLFNSFIFYGVLQTDSLRPPKVKKRSTGKGRIGIILFLVLAAAILCLLNGCSLKEPEQRMYPLALGVSQADQGYDISYACPKLAADDSQKDAATADTIETVTAQSLFEAQEFVSQDTDKTLDFNHLKVLVLDTEILQREDKMEKLLGYFMENENMAWNTYVVAMDDDMEKIFDGKLDVGKSLGTYLEDMIQGREDLKSSAAVTIKSLISQYRNRNEMILIPQLAMEEDEPVVAAYRIYSNMHDHGSISAKDAWMAFLLQGQAKKVSMTLENGAYITVGDIKTDRNIYAAENESVKEQKLPVQDLIIKGTLKVSGSTVVSGGEQEELLSLAQTQMEQELNRFVKEQSQKNYTDITDSFLKLSGYQRELYKLYQDNPEAYEKIVSTNAEVRLKLLNT